MFLLRASLSETSGYIHFVASAVCDSNDELCGMIIIIIIIVAIITAIIIIISNIHHSLPISVPRIDNE